MATKETRLVRGRRRGRMLATRTVTELIEARRTLGISQSTMATELGLSQPQFWRIEAGRVDGLSVVRICEIASLLGYEAALSLHPIGDPIRDKGQQALGRRFNALLAPAWSVIDEVRLPGVGDQRSWDKLLRLKSVSYRHAVGADLESRIYDIQALVRRTRRRESDGGVDEILIVLSDSVTNRRMADDLRMSLGSGYASSNSMLRSALRLGEPLPGSGVMLV
jgi:transcriptional regulator with XRE-family HTH domain